MKPVNSLPEPHAKPVAATARINTATRLQHALLLSLFAFALCCLPAQRSEAATIIETGDGYHVIAYAAGRGEAGAVALLVELVFNGRTTDGFQARTTVYDVFTEPGWSYSIKKPGGLNGVVEVHFSNGNCSARFRARYKPGKTVVDGGDLRCK